MKRIIFFVLFLVCLSMSVNAWWNVSYTHRKPIIISEGNATVRYMEPFTMNLTGLNLSTNNCSLELRLIANYSSETELSYAVIDSGGQNAASGSQWCMIQWLVNMTNAANDTYTLRNDTNYYVYYGYASGSSGDYNESLLGWDTRFYGNLLPNATGWSDYGTVDCWSVNGITNENYYWWANDSSATGTCVSRKTTYGAGNSWTGELRYKHISNTTATGYAGFGIQDDAGSQWALIIQDGYVFVGDSSTPVLCNRVPMTTTDASHIYRLVTDDTSDYYYLYVDGALKAKGNNCTANSTNDMAWLGSNPLVAYADKVAGIYDYLYISKTGLFPPLSQVLGAEETSGTEVYINYPVNNTAIWAYNVTFNVTPTTGSYPNFSCWYNWNGSGNILFNASALANVDTFFDLSYVYPAGNQYVVITCQPYGGVNVSSTVNFSVYWLNVTAQTYNSFAGELSEQYVNVTARLPPGVLWNASGLFIPAGCVYPNCYLTYNGSLVNISSSNIFWLGGSWFNVNFSVSPPLVSSNATNVSFYFTYVLRDVFGSTYSSNHSTANQTVVYSWYPVSLYSNKNNYLEMEQSNAYFIIANSSNTSVELSANLSFYYVNGSRLTENVSFAAYGGNLIGNSSQYLVGWEDTYYVNATNWTGVLYVSYGGTTLARTATNYTVNISRMFVGLCGVIANTTTENISIWDEQYFIPVYYANISTTLTLWTHSPSYYRNYTFDWDLNDTTNSIRLCLYPSWGAMNLSQSIYYGQENYSSRYYHIYGDLSNTTGNITLYLLSSAVGSQVIFYVVDSGGLGIEGVTVKIQRYNPSTGSYIQVASIYTDYEGKDATYLDVSQYYRYVLQVNGTTVKEINPSLIVCSSGTCPPYTVTLTYSEELMPDYLNIYGIDVACTFNTGTGILSCTTNDVSGFSSNTTLFVDKYNVLGSTNICISSCYTSACTLTCSLGNYTGYNYDYRITVYNNGKTYLLYSDSLEYATAWGSWGDTGLIIAFLIIILLFLAGAWNPTVSIGLSLVAAITFQIIGLLPITVNALIALVAVGALIMFKIKT